MLLQIFAVTYHFSAKTRYLIGAAKLQPKEKKLMLQVYADNDASCALPNKLLISIIFNITKTKSEISQI